MDNKDLVLLLAKKGGEVTAATVAEAIGNMTALQAAQTRENLKAEIESTIVEVTGATPSFAAADHTRYNCGEVTSLTVTTAPQTGEWMVIFYSGSTAAVLSLPNDISDHLPDSWAPEANKRYELNVLDVWPVVGEHDWEAPVNE